MRTTVEPETIEIPAIRIGGTILPALIDQLVERRQRTRGIRADVARREVHRAIVRAGIEAVQRQEGIR